MSRPPGVSFAQFFPAAPRAARDRATERERASRNKAADVPCEDTTNPTPPEPPNPKAPSIGSRTARSRVNGAAAGVSYPQPDDTDSHLGDALNAAVAAAGFQSSSHANSRSSTSCHAASQSQPVPTTKASNIYLTPLTSIDSPTYSSSTTRHPSHPSSQANDTPESSMPRATSGIDRPIPKSSVAPTLAPAPPAREPGRSVKGLKCVYDPFLDPTLSISDKRRAKPRYTEFGMDEADDAPPPDPRLARSGGRLNYIMVDFHLPKSRLRQAPYNLRPYPYDPKTSCGPGPPTQIMVTGFNPLTPFSHIIGIFASFGDIAESSNKMHPETGIYLGFASFRYRDSKLSRSRPTPVSAIDAAKRAVRSMNGKRIEAVHVRVDYDPDGRKSSRMLEEALKKERDDVAPLLNTKPSRTSDVAAAKDGDVAGPPPSAPKAPAALRAVVATAPTASTIPSSSSCASQPIEQQSSSSSIKSQLKHQPFIFVSQEHVPVMQASVYHMKQRLKTFLFEDIRADQTGYYIVFRDTHQGRLEAEQCARITNGTTFFTYSLVMQLHLHGTVCREHHRGRGPVRDRNCRAESRPREEQVQDGHHREEEEMDIEEEKRQRAQNFDPVKEAAQVVHRLMMEQLMDHIRTNVAAPALRDLLHPDKQAANRQKYNIDDPHDSISLSVGVSLGDIESKRSASTPDPIEHRTSRLNVAALPRIRKIKNTGLGSRKQHAFHDPFARERRPVRPIRSLHHRLRVESDDESDNESTRGRDDGRDTEEPESRSLSRIESEDEADKADSPWGMGDEDSMTEISFSVTDAVVPPLKKKKRKNDKIIGSALKRQKKSDGEPSVAKPVPVSDAPMSRADSVEVVADDVEGHEDRETDVSRSQTPISIIVEQQGKMKPPKAAKTTKKKQPARSRQRQQKLEEDHTTLTPEATEDTPSAIDVKLESDVVVDAPAESMRVEKPDLDPSLFPDVLTRAFVQPPDFLANTSVLTNLPLSVRDRPNFDYLRRKLAVRDVGDAELWFWTRDRLRELNARDDGIIEIEGYYVPNRTGCARTEGVKKILNSEKSKYLPHHIKVQKAREERQAKAAGKGGKDTTLVPEGVPSKGTSRANRANNRRFVADLNDQRKQLGQDSDVLRFNQLKKRKKPVSFARSAIHNWGLYAMENIPKDDMIIEYVGERVRQQISEIREKNYLKSGIGSSYLFRIDDTTVIDATKKGGIARFINHSCMPNCTAKIIKVNGTKRIVIYALRDIAQNEELTYDYKFEREIGATDRIPCLCGTAACKGFLN